MKTIILAALFAVSAIATGTSPTPTRSPCTATRATATATKPSPKSLRRPRPQDPPLRPLSVGALFHAPLDRERFFTRFSRDCHPALLHAFR